MKGSAINPEFFDAVRKGKSIEGLEAKRLRVPFREKLERADRHRRRMVARLVHRL